MRYLSLMCMVAAGLFSSQASSQDSNCSEALVMATYNRFDSVHLDWRLARYVSENSYDKIKKDYGLNVVIYGVPVGADYNDYQERARSKSESYQYSLTHDEATTVMWTGLDPNAPNVYSECLKAQIFSQPGLHLAVQSASESQVSVLVVWTPLGDQATATPEWIWKGEDSSALPKTLQAGRRVVVLPRPKAAQMLVANYKGYSDQLTLNPFPDQTIIKPIATFVETSEMYRSQEQVGWSTNYSNPYTLCTPEKPEGWTIVKVYDFHLESTTGRNTCGKWTTCGGSENDTPRRACRTTSVQGFEKNEYAGYGRIWSVFHVTWRHPVAN